jgi:hypothetical protein
MTDSILLTRTRELYRNRPASLKPSQIAAETGLSLPWLQDFGWGRKGDPGVTKVERLYTYLSGKPLDLGA